MKDFEIYSALQKHGVASNDRRLIEAVREILNTAAPAGLGEAKAVAPDRFFMEHGLWHDRVTGQHMYTQDQYDEESRACIAQGKREARAFDAAPVSPSLPENNRLADRMQIDRRGSQFWHSNCANHLGGVMKEIKREPDKSLLECLHCGKCGYYPVGGVGRIEYPPPVAPCLPPAAKPADPQPIGEIRERTGEHYLEWFVEPWKLAAGTMVYARPVAGSASGNNAPDGWYLQDTRSYVGNDVVWWAKDGKGYTTDISKAHVYGREEAFRKAAMRGADRAWPKSYIDGKTRPAVDMQYIDHAAAIAVMQGIKP